MKILMATGHRIKSLEYLTCLLLMLFTASALGAESTPASTDGYLARAEMQEKQGVTVTAAVPSAQETQDIFKTNLYQHGVQPVWLEITNMQAVELAFLPVGLDPLYFSPTEAANLDLRVSGDKTSTRFNLDFFDQSINPIIPAGETRSGFVFSTLDEGTKSFNVDIISADDMLTFTFFIPVPGLRIDHYNIDWDQVYPQDEIRNLSASELVEFLEAQTCCTSDKSSAGSGDPVNLVVIGDPPDVYAAFMRAGWDETETITGGTAWKTAKSFIAGSEYRYSPVSGLYVFGRPQDVAFQKARSNIHERNHLRLWLAPVRYDNSAVWLGQISRDIGVRFTPKTITTHKIDPDVDETREFLLEDLAYSQALGKFTYVEGAVAAPIDQPRGNLTGDPYFTDGYRLVLWISSTPVAIQDILEEKWKTPPQL